MLPSDPVDTAGSGAPDRYVVKTNHCDVVVVVNTAAGGLDPDLLSFEVPTDDNTAGLTMTTPLSAFAAKVVDIIEAQGTAGFSGTDTLREMLVKEKATQELRRLERFARDAGQTSA